MVKVTITGLHNLVVNKKDVSPMTIFNEADALYKALKVEGSDHVRVVYETEDGKEEEDYRKISETVRAMAAFVVKLYYRWDDNSMRLEHHYDLPTSIENILDMKKLTGNVGRELKFLSVRKLIENYLK